MILVLIVVMMLSYAAYSFSSVMTAEFAASTTSLRHIQRRELAESAIVVSSGSFAHRDWSSHDQTNIPGFSLTEPMELPLADGSIGYMAVACDVPDQGQSLQFGLFDESSRLNLNTLPLEQSKREESRQRLMALPNMSLTVADSILDWMDTDDDVSSFGAETSWYTAQRKRYRPRNGRLQSIRELLLVRGVTEELLYGEDRNGNGILDPNEDSGTKISPSGSGDGKLERGLEPISDLNEC